MGPSDATQTTAPGVESRADGSPSAALIGEVIERLRVLAAEQDRVDLVARLDEAAWRVSRTEMLICVVGEFKKGKSALINALLDADVCPVDDDLATAAVTVVRYDDEPSVTVRRREEGRLVVETVPPQEAPHWIVEHDQAHSRRGVELVEVGLPHPLLARGIALVDTPGVGGLNAAHAIATLAFLPSADALVFVTDASTELTAAELEFLARARAAGPPIIMAVTKVDMHPEWRRIVELDERHLADAGIELETIPVSSALKATAERLGDEAIGLESGLPRLHDAIVRSAADGARGAAVTAAVAEVMPAIDQLREPIETELKALERPENAHDMAADLRSVQARLETLSEADARWATRLDDAFDSQRTSIVFNFEGAMRQLMRDIHEEIEAIDPSRTWAEMGQRLQTDVATIVRGAFLAVTDGAAGIQRDISGMLAEAEEDFVESTSEIPYDVTEAWRGDPEFGGRTQTGMLATMGLLGGAVVGVEMLGMIGTLAGAAIVGPAAIGVALLFAGKQVVEERKRQLAERRQEARSFVTRFVEDVQFEAEGRLTALLGDLERQMRAHYAERIRQLQRTNEEALEALERAEHESPDDRLARSERLRSELVTLDDLEIRAAVAARAILPSS